MPSLRLQTNTPIAEANKALFLKAASQAISGQLGKEERFFMGAINDQCTMLFAGSSDPAAFLELSALGLATEDAPTLSPALCDLVATHLSIPRDRIYLTFHHVPRGLWGWNGTIF